MKKYLILLLPFILSACITTEIDKVCKTKVEILESGTLTQRNTGDVEVISYFKGVKVKKLNSQCAEYVDKINSGQISLEFGFDIFNGISAFGVKRPEFKQGQILKIKFYQKITNNPWVGVRREEDIAQAVKIIK